MKYTFPKEVYEAAFSPQAPVVVTVSSNLTLWSLPPKVLLEEMNINSNYIRQEVKFNKTGTRFLTAGTTLKVYETPRMITQVQHSGGELVIRWIEPKEKIRLESSDLNKPWTFLMEVTGSSQALPISAGKRFFRVAE